MKLFMNCKLVPRIGSQVYIDLLLRKFSNNTTYVSCKIITKLHFIESLFSNPGDKVLIFVESMGQICPIVFLLFRTLCPGMEKTNSLKYRFDNIATQLTYVLLLENCRNNNSMYSCSPIQGKSF